MGKCCGSPCHHEVCLIEAALHERGACAEHDQIVPGHYCPISVCRLNARRIGPLPTDYGRLEPIRAFGELP